MHIYRYRKIVKLTGVHPSRRRGTLARAPRSQPANRTGVPRPSEKVQGYLAHQKIPPPWDPTVGRTGVPRTSVQGCVANLKPRGTSPIRKQRGKLARTHRSSPAKRREAYRGTSLPRKRPPSRTRSLRVLNLFLKFGNWFKPLNVSYQPDVASDRYRGTSLVRKRPSP